MAELASIVVDFEQNPRFQQRWTKPVTGGCALSLSLLQGASRVCDMMGRPEEAAEFMAATEEDPRYHLSMAEFSEVPHRR